MKKTGDRYLVIGDPVVTLGATQEIPDGAVIVEGRRIAAVGPRTQLETEGPFTRTIGSQKHIVFPGLPNSHFHSAIFNEDRWIQYPVERGMPYYLPHSLTEEEHFHRTVLRLAACIRGGQTLVLDHAYGSPGLDLFGFAATLEAYQAVGLRVSLAIGTRDRNRYVHCSDEEFLASLPPDLREETVSLGIGNLGPADELLNVFRRLHREWHDPEKGTVLQLGPDWGPCTSDELYLENRRLASEYGVRMTTHACESLREMVFSLQHHRKTPMQRLRDLGILGPDVSCSHFVWATDEDIRILSDMGVIAVQNPGANIRIGNGITRVRDIMRAGGRVAFGTDGNSFSNSEDFLQELRLADLLQRVAGDLETGRIDSLEFLRSTVCNGAEASGYGDMIGTLVPGHEADLLVLGTERLRRSISEYPTRPPYESSITLASVLDYAASGDIEVVMIGGRVVLEDGNLTLVDEQKSRQILEGITRTRQEMGQDITSRLDPYVLAFYRRFPKPELTPASVYNMKDFQINDR